MALESPVRLVVFGCGYVGGAVAREAAGRGIRVTALTRNPATAQQLRSDGIDAIEGELSDGQWHARIQGAPDCVLNCVSSGGGGLAGYRRSYLEGMRSISAWMQKSGAPRVRVYTSSTSVYPQSGGAIVDETAATGGSERADVLVDAEQVFLAGATPDCRALVLRLAGIYGPARTHLPDQVRAGEVAGRGDHHLNLVHRDDIVAAILAAFDPARNFSREIVNLADDGRALKADIVAWLASRLGVPPPRFTGAPAGGRRAITPDRIIANDRAKTLLGWAPRFPDFRAGYENVLAHGAD